MAVSLHAPIDELRDELVPINRKYPIRTDGGLQALCRRRYARRVTFEYVMLDGIKTVTNIARAREIAAPCAGKVN